ncbi:MAG: Peptidase family [Ferruginibacter sp.]|nr:Peptidase family [Ferruginibacter sp.]
MRLLFTFLLLVSLIAHAQIPGESCKSISDIATMERLAHQRISSTETLTMASGNFDVKYYRCEWEVDPAIRYIKGKVTAYYTITSATNNISFDLMSPLVADSVKQHNALLGKSQANNTLTINFPVVVNAGTLDSVSIFYQGVPPNTGFGSFIQSTHSNTPVMWSLSEPYGSRDWWPCKNGLDDKADSIDILVTNPIGYRAAGNGILQSETINAGGTKITAHWKHRYAIATYLICFAVTNYSVFNNTVQLSTGILPMQTYCYPESLSSFQTGTINTLNAMQLYDTTFGPYPFMNEKYGHVQFGWGGGMEYQTSTFVVNIGESLCAHELGHQWFGDKITCGSWKDIWLNEGFATHLASMYMEKKYPANIISTRQSEINNITSQTGGSVEVSDTNDVNRIFDSRLSYTKGSHLLYMLRWKLGDVIFFNALRNYQTDPAIVYGFARTADLKKHLEQASGQNLTNFFNQWYSGQGYPTYNVQWSNSGSGNVWIKMNQVTSHTSVPFFELPVALKFSNATQSATVIVNNTSNGEVFTKSIGFVADAVVIDPEAWLITKNNTSTKLPTCGTVSNLTSSAITSTTATISWSAASGANNYDVEYKPASSSTWTNAATATTSLSVNLTGLTANSLYDWRVKPNCTAPTGNYVSAQFTTSAASSCPGAYDVSSNGTTVGAAIIPLNTDIKGTISPANDIDHYRFHITIGGTITVTLQTLPANYNLDLLNSSGKRIGRSNNSGTGNETINATVAAGDYYAQVYPSGTANNAAVCYTLKITTGTASRSAFITANTGVIATKLFPNPANGVVNISIRGYNKEKIIEVFDLKGKRLLSERVMQDDKALRISTLPSGLYIIKVTARDGTVLSRNKFVKE